MREARLAVVGIGNVGSTFIQGLAYYSNPKNKIGLWHEKIGGFRPSDLKVVAAFDIDPAKVGKPLSHRALYPDRSFELKDSKVEISPGYVFDTEAPQKLEVKTASAKEMGKRIEDSGADIVVSLISSGMDKTSSEYARISLKSGASFVNATPASVASNPSLRKQFRKEKLVLAGDDLLSQFGGTAFHKAMIDFMVERGVHVTKSYQLDVGGSLETKRTMDEHIKMQKREMKTDSIGMEAPYKFESVAGTTEYTDFLGDSRNSYYWMSSEGFLGSRIIMDLTLRTSDGPNAGNVILDVVRAAASKGSAKDSECISAYGFKSPPVKCGIRRAYSNFIKTFG